MTGPENYQEAERLLVLADDPAQVKTLELRKVVQDAAQVRATLAVADQLNQLLAAWRADVESVPFNRAVQEGQTA